MFTTFIAALTIETLLWTCQADDVAGLTLARITIQIKSIVTNQITGI
jgi:hypothetical protein